MIELFDNTSLSTFRLCPRKYEHRMVNHLVPIVSVNFKAEYGIAFHHAMDVWYKTFNRDAATKAFLDHWIPFEGQDSTGLRSLVNGMKMLDDYFTTYTTEPFTVDSVEIGFTVELGRYLYQGKCDGLVQYNDGKYYILEHKTSAVKGYLSLKPNHQIDGYVYGVGQLYRKPIDGCVLNQVYLGKKSNEFVREMTTRSKDEINDFITDATTWCDNINRCVDAGHFPKNTGSCNAYWKACEYKHICTAPLDSLPAIIEGCYIKQPWKPNGVVNDEN